MGSYMCLGVGGLVLLSYMGLGVGGLVLLSYMGFGVVVLQGFWC